jgi:hypothetical protein
VKQEYHRKKRTEECVCTRYVAFLQLKLAAPVRFLPSPPLPKCRVDATPAPVPRPPLYRCHGPRPRLRLRRRGRSPAPPKPRPRPPRLPARAPPAPGRAGVPGRLAPLLRRRRCGGRAAPHQSPEPHRRDGRCVGFRPCFPISSPGFSLVDDD